MESFTFEGMRKVGAEQVLDERLNQYTIHLVSFTNDNTVDDNFQDDDDG